MAPISIAAGAWYCDAWERADRREGRAMAELRSLADARAPQGELNAAAARVRKARRVAEYLADRAERAGVLVAAE